MNRNPIGLVGVIGTVQLVGTLVPELIAMLRVDSKMVMDPVTATDVLMMRGCILSLLAAQIALLVCWIDIVFYRARYWRFDGLVGAANLVLLLAWWATALPAFDTTDALVFVAYVQSHQIEFVLAGLASALAVGLVVNERRSARVIQDST